MTGVLSCIGTGRDVGKGWPTQKIYALPITTYERSIYSNRIVNYSIKYSFSAYQLMSLLLATVLLDNYLTASEWHKYMKSVITNSITQFTILYTC